MNKLLFWLLLSAAACAQVPAPVSRFKAKFAHLPMQAHLTWRSMIWGEEGTTEESFSARSYLRDTHLKSFPWSETVWADAMECQELDSNGAANRPQGNDEMALRVRWKLMSGAWMLDEGGFSPLPRDAAGNPRLRYQAPDTPETTLTFDPQGDLSEAAFSNLHMRFAHYRQQGADWLPTEVSVAYEGLVTPEAYQLQASVPAPELEARPAGTPQTQMTAEVPLSLVQDRWTQLPVNIDGTSYIFLMDTGASDTVIDSALAGKLGFARAGQQTLAAGLFKHACWVRCHPMEMGGMKLPERTMLGLDISEGPIATVFPGISGILGRDVFARSVVVIDYLHSRMRFLPRDTFQPEADDAPIECRREGPGLAVKVEIGGQTAYFTLDTGSGGGILVQHMAGQKRWVPKAGLALRDPEGARFGSGVAATWPGLGDVRIGRYVWKGAPLEIVDESSSKGSSLVTPGNLGVGFWRHFRVTIDLTGGRLWLAQQRPFRAAHPAILGLHVGPGLKISAVLPNGPGAKAGLKTGDVIVRVNGGSASSQALDELFSQAQAGEVFELDIQSDGVQRHLRLRAASLP